jgi:glucose-1-phosphate cytidylyltransferase
MKVVIFCGGMGTRLREETEVRPKPMVDIGGRPILWHIMKLYAQAGWKDFVLALGYKGDVIRDYFLHYEQHNRDVTVTLGSRDVVVHGELEEAGWQVTLADTGLESYTGTRLKRAARYLGDRFLVTYGDGLADIDLDALLRHHVDQGRLGTVTAVRPSSRFGELAIEEGMVKVFREKPQIDDGWINGGFFVFEKAALAHLGDGQESLEQGLLVKLAEMGQLSVYQHGGFWQCMDTYREVVLLNEMWRSGRAPWARGW